MSTRLRQHIFLICLLMFLPLILPCSARRYKRRLDSSEYEYQELEASSELDGEEDDQSKVQELMKKAAQHPDMRSRSPPDGGPAECGYTPCAWTFYTNVAGGEREVVLSFNNKNCFCRRGTSCEYYEDYYIINAFLHRCVPK